MSANTIIILGAGATRAVTLKSKKPSPLATDFFKDNYLKGFMTSSSISGYKKSQLRKIILQYFKDKDSINIEEVYSFIDFAENNLFHDTIDEKLSFHKAKYELIEYLFHTLSDLEYDSTYYEKIISNFKPGDSIISFNWDVVMDEVLLNLDNEEVFFKSIKDVLNPIRTFEDSNYDNLAYNNFHQSYFIKMHGSINWGICSNEKCLRHQIPFINKLNSDSYPSFWNCNYCGNKIEILLMPPHLNKNFKVNRVFNLQAKIAFDKIKTAKKIVIIGYSFPDNDFEVNALFRKAKLSPLDLLDDSELFLEEIHLVDPNIVNPEFVKKIEGIFGLKNKSSYNRKVKLFTYKDLDSYIKTYK